VNYCPFCGKELRQEDENKQWYISWI
jgi:hypothetical protein